MIVVLHQGLLTAFISLAVAMVINSSNAEASEGQEVYQKCVACHQPNGAGIPGMFPALKDRLAAIIASVEGREYVTMVLIDGLIGTLEIEGQRYRGAMPAQNLTDAQIAAVIEYVVTDFEASEMAGSNLLLSKAEVAEIRSKYAGVNAYPTNNLRSKVPVLSVH